MTYIEEFSLKEYESCWDYLRSIYQERDKSFRYFITALLGSGALSVGLLQYGMENQILHDFYSSIGFIMLAPFLFGIAAFDKAIALRKTAIRFHKAIIRIRGEAYNGSDRHPLFTDPAQLPYLNWKGFNAAEAGVLAIGSGIAAGAVVYFSVCLDISKIYLSRVPRFVVGTEKWGWALATALAVFAVLASWYITSLKSSDKNEKNRWLCDACGSWYTKKRIAQTAMPSATPEDAVP